MTISTTESVPCLTRDALMRLTFRWRTNDGDMFEYTDAEFRDWPRVRHVLTYADLVRQDDRLFTQREAVWVALAAPGAPLALTTVGASPAGKWRAVSCFSEPYPTLDAAGEPTVGVTLSFTITEFDALSDAIDAIEHLLAVQPFAVGEHDNRLIAVGIVSPSGDQPR